MRSIATTARPVVGVFAETVAASYRALCRVLQDGSPAMEAKIAEEIRQVTVTIDRLTPNMRAQGQYVDGPLRHYVHVGRCR